MKASGSISTRSFPARTKCLTMSGKTWVSNWSQNGHCRSMNSRKVTGALEDPRVVPRCGIPLKSEFTSPFPGSGFALDFELEEPRVRTTASTIATATRSRTPPMAPMTFGDACGRCLLFLPLGISALSPRHRRERQQGEEQQESGQSERWDGHVAELVDPFCRTAARRRNET